jgi:septal ring factor EnvC (AmiA/AmiB activator)
MNIDSQKKELPKLRRAEARLENKLREERAEMNRITEHIISLATQLSDCKKAIAQFTLVREQRNL